MTATCPEPDRLADVPGPGGAFSPSLYWSPERAAAFLPPVDPAIDVSVIIVNYNCGALSAAAARSVLATAGGLGVEVVVVDNASTDDSLEVLREAFGPEPRVEVVDAGHNGGYAWGNNVGMARARGRHVLVLNPDTVLHEGTLSRAVAYLDAHRDVGMLGARALLEDGTQQSTLFRDLRLSHLFWRMLIPSRVMITTTWFGDQRYAARDMRKIQDVDIVAGCFMMLPRSVIARIGPMDPRFFMYSEEAEWCWRIRRAGLAVRYHPDITITHYGAATTGWISPWKAEQLFRGHALYLRFTRGPLVAWLGMFITAIGEALRLLLIGPVLLTGRGRQAGAIWKARMGFLLGALVSLPRGQEVPPLPALGRPG